MPNIDSAIPFVYVWMKCQQMSLLMEDAVCVCLEIPLYRLNRISFGDFNKWALRCVQFNHATLNSVSNLRSRLQAIRLTIKGVYSERYLHLLFKLKNGIAVSLNCAQVLLKCNKYSFSPECECDSLCVFMLRPLHIPFSVLWTFFSSPFFSFIILSKHFS